MLDDVTNSATTENTGSAVSELTASELDRVVERAHAALGGKQNDDGHWVFELEADATIPAEYVLLEHFLDRIDQPLEDKIGVYLRRIQGEHGGWPLYHDGEFNISATVKAYYALKCIGDDINAPHMQRARQAVLDHGGAERTNVFTRFQLALFGEIPWHGTPVMPVELMLLPRSAFFSVWNMSYWSRTVIAPLLVLAALRPVAVNPRGVHVQELFVTPPDQVKDWIKGPYRSKWGHAFKVLDQVLRPVVKLIPQKVHKKAIRASVDFIEPRLNGIDGLGAIYPAMANTVMMYRALGVPDSDPRANTAWESVRALLVDHGDEVYCQPCVSPIWDTGLAGHAMMEAGSGPNPIAQKETQEKMAKAAEWLRDRQILDVKGDWAINRPDLEPGGWAFQYRNDYYPDVDDTAVVGMLLHRQNDPANDKAIERARKWIVGMQSTNGGWGAFDVDNNKELLNHIPFSDHGALLDPPTADVTARCISFLAQLGHAEDRPVIERALDYLRGDQEQDGSWFGRWGTNYIYGTWSVLCALNAAGVSHDDPMVVRAVEWLRSVQRPDGGWGEGCESYEDGPRGRYKESLPSQTAWAVLGMMAVGRRDDPAVKRGIAWLSKQQGENGEWEEEPYNAVGFPKVFYLKYHGYKQFFPLLAVSRYRNLQSSNSGEVSYGF
ncbi:squalene--hopene cyclase [Acetobacter aceti NRIC 0242]|uniref:Squalene-hopene cyclase n=1 Tax=Acetobacter aceti NBRC 14818 TaxID=887700 RepID=A0AB33IBU8_ACEAC|nr:squalene--hopene cyclase [Acetobacter aceti]TCS34115.1 squalene-hopene/tetraprenyl-beta-curcumene cyclase [Acetobacter aceti NBRC 14818]BCK75598.1 squalene-hopene cyclase [Acetobacter aceti NBRC 14818]GAN56639.1 squalene--hopene cyclase [Acetobacter aceti NBRC 14818]GBO79846.1 squalene--hopene cyclase [Acetobacter aceti NRIC 0242]